MITTTDHDLVISMVGPVFKEGYPSDFKQEYEIRLAMLARAGTVGGLGPVGLMQLLRDFNVQSLKSQEKADVSDWRLIEKGTIIYSEGKRGIFDSVSGDGRLLVKFDGYRPLVEVNMSTVQVKADIIEGVRDEAFERDPEDVPSAKAMLEEKKGEPSMADKLFAEWSDVEAGETVMVEISGESFEAEFVDVEGEKIAVILDDEVQAFEASQVTPPVKA